MNQDPEIYNDKSQKYQLLLELIENLFKRQNLCCNTYIYKQMKAELILPLYVILDQNSIAALKFQRQIVIQAIEESGLAKVFNNRQVKLYQFPTVKIHFKQHDAIKALQAILEEKSIIYKLSKRPETNEYINLTIFSQNIIWLEKLIENIGKQIVFQRVRLLNDMKIGVDKIRKLKFHHAKLKTAVGKATYSLVSPPKKFIRKALQSSDSQQQESITKALGKFSKMPKKINQKTVSTVQQFPRLLS